jgi:hypothetical protein
LLGLSDGGFRPTAWGWAALALLGLAAGFLLAARSVPAFGRLEVVCLAALAALLAWTLISVAWSLDPAESVLEGERTLMYLAAALTALLVFRRLSAALLLATLLAAISLIASSALVAHLLSGKRSASELVGAVPYAESKLAGSLGYSNALGLLAVLGILLASGFAARLKSGFGRAGSGAAFVVLATTLYLTFGRGAWAALALGVLAMFAVDPRRLELSAVLLALAVPTALALLLAAGSDALTHHGSPHDELVREGTRLALAVLVLSAAAAGVAYLAPRIVALLVEKRGRRRAYAAVVGTAAAAILAAGVIVAGGPVKLARQAYGSFETPSPSQQADLNRRLLSLSGSGRAEYWRVAWEAYREHPALGAGAGSFGREWLRERHNDLPVRDAHSLYLETLAELGPVGLALLLAFVGAPLAAGLRARRQPLAPVSLGAYAAYLAHAGIDWDWELPAVTIAGLACGLSLLLLAREEEAPRRDDGLVLPAAVVMLVLAAVAALGLLGNRAAATSSDAYEAGHWREAIEQAQTAIRWMPWSAQGWRLLGEAQLARGEVKRARASFLTGLEKDSGDWELWLDLALASEGEPYRHALARASALNPRSPEIRELRAGD